VVARNFLLGVVLAALIPQHWSHAMPQGPQQSASGETTKQAHSAATEGSAATVEPSVDAPETPCGFSIASDCQTSCEEDCEGSCEEGIRCNMCPCTYGEVEGLFLMRSTLHASRPILIDANTQATLVPSSDFNSSVAPGIRARFGFCLWGCRPVEFGYFGLFDSRASLDYVRPNPNVDVTLPGPLGVASDVFHDGVHTRLDYVSRLQGAEVNFPCCCCWESCCGEYAGSREWFVGFRYLSLREDFRILGRKPVRTGVETGFYDISSSRNDLFGAQVGARMRRCRGRLSWEATGKVGVFGNQAGQEQIFVDYPGFLLRPLVSSNGGSVAFVGELNLTGIYRLNDTWGLRAGYNLMWIEGVALAPDQLDFSFTAASGTGLDRGGGLFLHGVNLGLEARW
jgi:hypothetical protein